MKAKFLTKADKFKDEIIRIKEIMDSYNKQLLENDVRYGTIEEVKERLILFQKLLKDSEISYNGYLKNNEPYYESNSYEYYKDRFSKSDNFEHLNFVFALDIISFTEDKRIKSLEKARNLKNIVKAYKERDIELNGINK